MESKSKGCYGLEFFKVFLPTSTSLHLCLPPAFVNYFEGTLPSKAILKDEIGKSWHVTLEKVDNRVYFTNGWQAFVDDHFLKYGDFLIFQYDGNDMFGVKMFGKNGLKRELVVGDVKIESEPRVSCNGKHLGVGSNGKSAKPNAPTTTGPWFERRMRRSSGHTLYIPSYMFKKNEILMKPKIVLRDEKGKLWAAVVCSSTFNRYFIAGWSKFYRDHSLKVNDKCEFEFVVGEGNVCGLINVKFTRHSLPLGVECENMFGTSSC